MSTLAATNLKHASSGSNNIVLNSDGTTTIAAPSNIIKSGTAVVSTSGTSIDFTGIPSWVKRVTVMFDGVSTSGTSVILVQLGTTSGAETTGYISTGSYLQSTTVAGSASYTTGFPITSSAIATSTFMGSMLITLLSTNKWVANGGFARGDNNVSNFSHGSKTLSGALDRVRITTVNGTDTFDAGTINILYEG